jgi:uncharacterized membrane protein (DUF373 family)
VIPIADRAMKVAEMVIYGLVAVLLVAAGVVVLVSIAWDLATDLDGGVVNAATAALNGLLLVFILVELLAAVRETIEERKLVAEPFLIVGIIASIKEIVVASLKASEAKGDAFREALAEVGVLGAVVVALAVASFLVRRKEREPTEG